MVQDEKLRDIQRQSAKIAEAINRLAGDSPTLLFREYATKHLAQKLANPTLRDSTKELFRNQIEKHLRPAFGPLPLDQITNATWLKWVTSMREAGGPLTRFFMPRKCLVEVLNAAKFDGLIERMPKLDNPDVSQNVGRVLTDKEVLSIIWHSHRPFRFIFYAFWCLGCRPKEILQYTWEMLDWRSPTKAWVNVPARISKTDRSRSYPIPPDLCRKLLIRKASAGAERFIFPSTTHKDQPQLSYDTAWRTACKKANVKKCVPYDFRRTFLTKAAAENLPLVYVAKCLDTSAALIEKVYAKAQEDIMERIMT